MTRKSAYPLLWLLFAAALLSARIAGAQESAPDAQQAPSAEQSDVPEITETTSCGERCELFALSNDLKILVKKIPGAPITSV